ncbi:Alpha/beta-Hydrolases superfamily protein [Hibiscus syriacus]|uniref:Alpha/beta-Hydrolases superfamily protein n=1 Tax=Hibiscus syriacus TaxID=106335 RepID=A0A6A2X8L1_HIBSY|nr:Alpha/beta-Hydrolases superfamily protein [Hibiscus syriacus]
MATKNPFDLLDDDTEDPSLLIASVEQQKLEKPKKAPASAPAQPGKAAKLPTKPPPPAQAAMEAKSEPGRGGGRGTGHGHGGSGFNRESKFSDNSNGFSGLYRPSEEGGGGNQTERRGYGCMIAVAALDVGMSSSVMALDVVIGVALLMKLLAEENVPEHEKNVSSEKQPGEEDAADAGKENAADAGKENAANETEERKADVKEFESMQQLSNKKSNDVIFIKLGSEKDRRKDAEREERAKKAVSINEFLKPAEGERYYGPGRGRGCGRGPRGGYGGNTASNVPAPSIEDPGHFPSLGGK